MFRVLDWDKAASIIKENGYKNVRAGLREDWFWTGGDILVNGEIVDQCYSTCLIWSSWATPIIRLYCGACEGCDEYHAEYECFREVEKDYAEEYWPESARKILEE